MRVNGITEHKDKTITVYVRLSIDSHLHVSLDMTMDAYYSLPIKERMEVVSSAIKSWYEV